MYIDFTLQFITLTKDCRLHTKLYLSSNSFFDFVIRIFNPRPHILASERRPSAANVRVTKQVNGIE